MGHVDDRPVARDDAREVRPDDVALGREEPRVARLQRQHLAAVVAARRGPRRRRSVAGHRVVERRVRHLSDTRSPGAAGRSSRRARGRRAMPRDVDEVALARHERLRVEPGPFLSVAESVPLTSTMSRPGAGSRSARSGCPPWRGDGTPRILARRAGRVTPSSRSAAAGAPARPSRSAPLVVEPALLPPRVQRRERVVPLPDDERPRENNEPGDDQGGAEAAPELLPRGLEAVSVAGVCASVSIVERVDGELTVGPEPGYSVPPRSTSGTVRTRIFRSSQSEKFSM